MSKVWCACTKCVAQHVILAQARSRRSLKRPRADTASSTAPGTGNSVRGSLLVNRRAQQPTRRMSAAACVAHAPATRRPGGPVTPAPHLSLPLALSVASPLALAVSLPPPAAVSLAATLALALALAHAGHAPAQPAARPFGAADSPRRASPPPPDFPDQTRFQDGTANGGVGVRAARAQHPQSEGRCRDAAYTPAPAAACCAQMPRSSASLASATAASRDAASSGARARALPTPRPTCSPACWPTAWSCCSSWSRTAR